MRYNEIDDIIDIVLKKNYLMPRCLTKKDLKQIAWLEIIEKLHKYNQHKGSFYSYIYCIAKNAIVRHLIKHSDYTCRRFEEVMSGKSDAFHFHKIADVVNCADIADIDSGIEAFEKEDEIKLLRKKINRAKRRIRELGDLHIRCFELHFEEGVTIPKVAEMLNIAFQKAKGCCRYSQILFRKEFLRNRKKT